MMDEYSILKKKKKKNGFAATALLVSIGIIILLIALYVLFIGKIGKNNNQETICNDGVCTTVSCSSKEKIFNENLKMIKDAAISYFTNERLPSKVDEVRKITLGEMQNEKLVLSVIDSNKKTCDKDKSYVLVTKEANEYVMKIYLSCSDMEDYILIHLGCYDYCNGNICEKQDEHGTTEFEYEYRKTTSCTMSDWSAWGEWTTVREATSNLKKEDVKTETTVKTIVDTKSLIPGSTSYNCNNWGSEYTLSTDNKYCLKYGPITDSYVGTPIYSNVCSDSTYTYNSKTGLCEKVVPRSGVLEQPATLNPATYEPCQNGTTFNASTLMCEGKAPYQDVKDVIPVADEKKCPSSDYDIVGNKCVKTEKKKTTVDKVAVYEDKSVKKWYWCNKEYCTTKLVFSCDTTCGNKPQTTCEYVKEKCYYNTTEKTLSGYVCPDGTVESGDKCIKYVDVPVEVDVQIIKHDPTCPSGYNLSSDKKSCVATLYKDISYKAVKKADTYNCDNLKKDGYVLSGNKCLKSYNYNETLTMKATKVVTGVSCKDGYMPNGNNCEKHISGIIDQKASNKVVTPDTCPSGYDIDKNGDCTKTTKQNITTTYYRYATRTCDGGSTDTKWSSYNDSYLIGNGYTMTGNKREITKTTNNNSSQENKFTK